VLIGDAKIERVRLDLTEHELNAFVDYLDSHEQNLSFHGKWQEGKTYITKQTGKLEIPIARCRDTLNAV
jgi:hypothetical protein